MTTVKNFGALGESWVAYHLATGFMHLYIFFDDPSELTTLDLQARFSKTCVSCIPHDATLRAAWAALPTDKRMLHLAANEVQTRQQLNARHAISLAHARGIDWLLHIDADELFYPGPRGDAATHFRALSQRDVATFCYYNHEAVPETHGIVDPFREVTLFKRSLEVVERSDRAAAAVDFWQTRQEGSFFYYYDNGKAAVRVRPGARPLSVHEWIPGSADGMQHWYSNMREPWDGRGELGRIVQHMESDACILHYPCYNAEVRALRPSASGVATSRSVCWPPRRCMRVSHWLESRPFQALWVRWRRGNDNYRLGGREEPPPLHAHVCRAADAAYTRGGEAAARVTVRRLFEEQVMLEDARQAEEQIFAGVCMRIRAPSRTLAAVRPR